MSSRSSRRASIPETFVVGATSAEVKCGPGQYHYANQFGAGCTDMKKDRRSLGCGGYASNKKPLPLKCRQNADTKSKKVSTSYSSSIISPQRKYGAYTPRLYNIPNQRYPPTNIQHISNIWKGTEEYQPYGKFRLEQFNGQTQRYLPQYQDQMGNNQLLRSEFSEIQEKADEASWGFRGNEIFGPYNGMNSSRYRY